MMTTARLPQNPQPKEWLASELSQQRIADYKPFNFVDGEGVVTIVSPRIFGMVSHTLRNWKIGLLRIWVSHMFKA